MINSISMSAAKSALASISESGSATAPSATAPNSDFGSVMKQVVSDSIGSMEAGETTAIQGLQGAVPAYKVVEAVMGAQRTLQAALAIRDKAVSAFQEITRMSI